MSTITDDPMRNAALHTWIEALGGGSVSDVQRVAGGAYRTSARIRLRNLEGGERSLFVKVDLGSAPSTPFDLKREYEVLSALNGRGNAPRVLGYHDQLTAMTMECLDGSADYAKVQDAGSRARIEESFVAALFETHRVDLSSLGLEHLPAGLTMAEAIAADLQLWRTLLLESVAEPDPIALFALAWCAERMPNDSRPAVLVQGDAGPGNFLFDADRVTGLVDWEMAHLGHPLEDIGCVLARSLVQPMSTSDRLLSLYQAVSGVAWTKAELLYATILVMTRFSVPINLALASRNTGLDLGLTDGYYRMSQISLLRLIAQAEGISLDETIPESGTKPLIGFEFEYLASVLSTIVRPNIADDYARYRLDGAVGLIGYLANVFATQASGEVADPLSSLEANAALIAEGQEPLRRAIQGLFSDALYRERLMKDMLGPLHGRRIAIG